MALCTAAVSAMKPRTVHEPRLSLAEFGASAVRTPRSRLGQPRGIAMRCRCNSWIAPAGGMIVATSYPEFRMPWDGRHGVVACGPNPTKAPKPTTPMRKNK